MDAFTERRSRRLAEGLALIGAVGPVAYVVFVTVLGMLWQGYDRSGTR